MLRNLRNNTLKWKQQEFKVVYVSYFNELRIKATPSNVLQRKQAYNLFELAKKQQEHCNGEEKPNLLGPLRRLRMHECIDMKLV